MATLLAAGLFFWLGISSAWAQFPPVISLADLCPKVVPPSFTLTWAEPKRGGPVDQYRVYVVAAPNMATAVSKILTDRGERSSLTEDPTPVFTVIGLTEGRWYFAIAGINDQGQGKLSPITCARVLAPPA